MRCAGLLEKPRAPTNKRKDHKEMPIITDNHELRNFFLQKLQDKSAPIRTEIHVSDLTFCLRKAYWRRFDNRKLSEQQLIFFLDGHQRHEGLQGLVKNLEHEVEIKRYGIVGHLDLMDKNPVEIKTTRVHPNGQKPNHYLRQGAYYCLLTGTDTFSLITQYINDGILTFETITFGKQELDDYLEDMLADRDILQEAYDAKNIRGLPFPQGDWQCGKCEFQGNCYKK